MWFRQDLRLTDNPALSAAAADGPVIPVFILDDETPGNWRLGRASRWWLHHSLEALQQHVPLVLKHGETEAALKAIIKDSGARALYFARDYAPWSGALEARIKAMCGKLGVDCRRYGGFLLHEPEAIRSGSGQFFKVYTPFSRACRMAGQARSVKPIAMGLSWHRHAPSEALAEWGLLPKRPDWASQFPMHWQPGEAGAQKRLAEFLAGGLKGYADGRDRPDQSFTSRLSAHLHWGEVSVHHIWHRVKSAIAAAHGALDRDGEKFLGELLWREFSHHLLHHVPSLPEKPFRPEFNSFPWVRHGGALRAWQMGQTGYPIVDAGMRELWATGTMHNRVRMIAASFLVKHLLIPWQEGERWFWDTLVDADIANNAASWQWVAGCGADAAPYFRVFNPVLQGEKFDPTGAYVRRWVPELADVPNAFIHKPWDMTATPQGYPRPIVDHQTGRQRALAAFDVIKREGVR